MKNGVEGRTTKADEELTQVQIEISVLRKQWELQRAAQLSLKNRKLGIYFE